MFPTNAGNRGPRGDRIGDLETLILICVDVEKQTFTGPHSSHQRFITKEEDKRSCVSSSNKMVNSALGCETVNVSTKLGNKGNQ